MHVPAAKTADLFVPASPPLGRLPPVPEAADEDSDFDSGEIPTDELDRLGQAPSPQRTTPAPPPEAELQRGANSKGWRGPAIPEAELQRVQTQKAGLAPQTAPRRSARLGGPQLGCTSDCAPLHTSEGGTRSTGSHRCTSTPDPSSANPKGDAGS
jgi:hypothetical protein